MSKNKVPVEAKPEDWWPTKRDIAIHLEWLTVSVDAWSKKILEENMKLWNRVNYLQERIEELEK